MKLLDNERVNMRRKTCFATIFVAVLCLLTSGCYNLEQEIFLEPDGSGDMVMYFSMPDIPETMMKEAFATKQDPQKLFDEFKQKFATDLPPEIKLKEMKDVRRNGATAVYILLHFNQLNDLDSMLDKYLKGRANEARRETPINIEALWKIQLEKVGDRTAITQRFYSDIEGALGAVGVPGTDKPESTKAPSDSSPVIDIQASATPKSRLKPGSKRTTRRTARAAKPVAPKEENPAKGIADDPMKELMTKEILSTLLSTIFRLRFVLHAPRKITETNADIVLNEKIAIWNASFGAFVKENKPIEMKVTY
jgi:hypothetical protein